MFGFLELFRRNWQLKFAGVFIEKFLNQYCNFLMTLIYCNFNVNWFVHTDFLACLDLRVDLVT